jgi:hypothetical protein
VASRRLDRLDEIDWARLRGPYGESWRIPRAIRDVWSDDPDVRGEGVQVLQEHLLHQGTVFEVTAAAVPFVADAALGDVVGRDDRIWLVLLLAWIASGSSFLDAHREFLEERGQAVDPHELERELAWVRTARSAVRQRLPEFLDRLAGERDPGTQVALAVLAAQFPECAGESAPHLRRIVDAEPTDPRRLVLELAVAAATGEADAEDLFRRLPSDYYGPEDVGELRGRLAAGADPADVHRQVLDDVVGVAIDLDTESS